MTFPEITTVIISVTITALISGIIALLFNHIDKEVTSVKSQTEQTLKISKLQSDALMELLFHNISETHKEVIKNNKVTRSTLEKANNLYKAYSELGGNGTAAKMLKDINSANLKIAKHGTIN